MKRDASTESLEGPVLHGFKHARETKSWPSTVVVDSRSCQRFFVLDWLETSAVEDIAKANGSVGNSSYGKSVISGMSKKQSNEDEPDRDISKIIEYPQRNLTLTPPRHPLINPARPMPSAYRTSNEALGNVWNSKGVQKAKNENWEDALSCWEKALDIRIHVLGDGHKDVANTLNNMGVALGRIERHEDALQYLERALRVRERLYGRGHIEIASTLHNIGNVLQQMEEYTGALKCFKETKRIQSKILGNKDIQVARTLNAIGHLHFERATDYANALEAYMEARDVFLRAGLMEDNEELEITNLDIAEVLSLLQRD